MPLYLVATPIGNLSDQSERAREILARAHVLAAEDTRSARRLLAALNIGLEGRDLVSYGDHNEKGMAPRLAEALKNGRDVAVLSEGGTPLVSDPGFRLVREAIAAGIPVVPVPGACAAVAALGASGLPVHGFIFRGFLPKKPGARRRILESLKDREETLIFYESPQRIGKVLPEFVELFGAGRPACIARELTKLHETFHRGTLGELAALFTADHAPKGECTVLIAGRDGPPDEFEEES
ncbi:MAG: 16S rRNA (cytidine(1402)-2'-O)-methyltransferase [Planctomycetota bacterium]|nr:16S rRNA (cytidine(1402)-2'-O)-methyltransferase [Planctomycetota bacterium]